MSDGRIRPVDSLLSPSSVALVGASERRPALLANVLASPAKPWLVNPARETVGGIRCFPSLSALPEPPDVAVLAVAHNRLLPAAEEAIAKGVGALVVPGIGAEAGRDGAPIAAALDELVGQRDVPVLGPNCMGYVRPGETALWIGSLPPSLESGSVSVLAQSGSAAEGLVALGGRVGFRSVVSSGGELNRDAADFVSWFADDDGTHAIGLYLETIRRPVPFASALVAAAEAGKPVVCLKVGRSEAAKRVALAHTGALAGSSRACSAFLRAHGVIEVGDLPELVETLEILGRRRWPAGLRAAAISESGGEAALLADHGEAHGLVFGELGTELTGALEGEFPNYLSPTNPLDAWAIDEPERVFPRSLELLAASGRFDMLLALVDLTQFRSDADQVWCHAVVRGLADAVRDRDLFGAVVSSQVNDPPEAIARFAREADLALLRGIATATKSIAAVVRWRPRLPPTLPASTHRTAPEVVRGAAGPLSEYDSGALLEAYGIAVAPRRLAASQEAAVAAAEELGFPVVVKAHGPAHKSVIGGVALDLRDAAGVAAAADRLLELSGELLVAEQIPRGIEVMCGAERDSDFGPVIALGGGGSFAERPELASLSLAPLVRETAEELVESVPWLAGIVKGEARARLVAALVALSRLVVEHPEIEAVDVNPLVVGAAGAVAVDALVVVGDRSSRDASA